MSSSPVELKQRLENTLRPKFNWANCPKKFSILFIKASRNNKKEDLLLNNLEIGDDELHWILSFLDAHPHITYLNVANNRISTSGAILLANNITLKNLNLNGNDIGDEGAQALANNAYLENLELRVKSNFSKQTFEAFAQNRTLIVLDLGGIGVNDECAVILAQNTDLHTLVLTDNKIGDAGAIALAANKTLAIVELKNNKITNIGEQALKNNKNLQCDLFDDFSADISNSNITMDSEDEEHKEIEEFKPQLDIVKYDKFLLNMKFSYKEYKEAGDVFQAYIQGSKLSYTQFLDYLYESKKIVRSEYDLYTGISPQELAMQCAFILQNATQILDLLKKQGSVCMFSQYVSPRTFILRIHPETQEILYFVFLNSKKADMSCAKKILSLSTYSNNLNQAGASKIPKTCFDLNAILTVKNQRLISKEDKLKRGRPHPFAKEAEFATRFADDYAAKIEHCMYYRSKRGNMKAIGFSKSALCSLEKLIGDYGLMYNQESLSTLDRFKFIKSILVCVSKMHQQDCIHQDLKPRNILVYLEYNLLTQKEELIAKLCDFSEATSLKDEKSTLSSGTYAYASREIFIANSEKRDRFNQYLQKHMHSFAYGYFQYNLLDTTTIADRESYKRPTKENDMWALGLILYQIMYGPIPRKCVDTQEINRFIAMVNKDLFISSFLKPDPTKRISIELALEHVDRIIDTITGNITPLLKCDQSSLKKMKH